MAKVGWWRWIAISAFDSTKERFGAFVIAAGPGWEGRIKTLFWPISAGAL